MHKCFDNFELAIESLWEYQVSGPLSGITPSREMIVHCDVDNHTTEVLQELISGQKTWSRP